MTRKEIVKMVIEIIIKIIRMSDFKMPSKLDETLQPIGDIVGTGSGSGSGFDSMNGVEFAAMVDQKISIGDVGNLCASPDGSKALNVGEIADRILAAKS
ncbi:MAG: hypothetical protein K8S55_04175 [Phycisphaerae bacterium]|nr:hypothetical protein [Phycisphaerae bacterium]